jgi:hypothetical protein
MARESSGYGAIPQPGWSLPIQTMGQGESNKTERLGQITQAATTMGQIGMENLRIRRQTEIELARIRAMRLQAWLQFASSMTNAVGDTLFGGKGAVPTFAELGQQKTQAAVGAAASEAARDILSEREKQESGSFGL